MMISFKRIQMFLVWTTCIVTVSSAPLLEPLSIDSEGGILETILTLENTVHTIPDSGITLSTRLFNGMFPGPTLRLRAGDTLNINFFNQLNDQGAVYVHNQVSAPDESNLHFHGLHVSGELPSDDSTHVVRPQESYQYSTYLPEDHMPGTHWLHPHRHGSTALQVGGGATSVIIVEDEPGELPAQVENAKDVIFMVNPLNLQELQQLANESGDGWFQSTVGVANRYLGDNNKGDDNKGDDNDGGGGNNGGGGDDNGGGGGNNGGGGGGGNNGGGGGGGGGNNIVTVNGQLNPTITIDAGEWMRLRVVWASWVEGTLDLSIPNCEMQLLAKDGIYIRNFPRPIQVAPIVPAGRADIMVRCMAASTAYNINGSGRIIATITTSATVIESTPLNAWTPVYPQYLSDLSAAAVDTGCSCAIQFSGRTINNASFQTGVVLHESSLGSTVERFINTGKHPFHQHVYPYQLTTGFGGYNALGDWHDTILGSGSVRYKSTVFPGKIMIHCHLLKHEDEGMMAIENVRQAPGCDCNLMGAGSPFIPFTRSPTSVISLTASPSTSPSPTASLRPSISPTNTIPPSNFPTRIPSNSPTNTIPPSNFPTRGPSNAPQSTICGLYIGQKFKKLDKDIQKAAKKIKWKKWKWDKPGSFAMEYIRFENLTTVDTMTPAGWYKRLKEKKLKFLTVLNLNDAACWNYKVNHYQAFKWNELDDVSNPSGQNVMDLVKVLGYDEITWNNKSKSIPNDICELYSSLDSNRQDAAKGLGYSWRTWKIFNCDS